MSQTKLLVLVIIIGSTLAPGRNHNKSLDRNELEIINRQQSVLPVENPIRYDIFMLNVRHDLITCENIYPQKNEITFAESSTIASIDNPESYELFSSNMAFLIYTEYISPPSIQPIKSIN